MFGMLKVSEKVVPDLTISHNGGGNDDGVPGQVSDSPFLPPFQFRLESCFPVLVTFRQKK